MPANTEDNVLRKNFASVGEAGLGVLDALAELDRSEFDIVEAAIKEEEKKRIEQIKDNMGQ